MRVKIQSKGNWSKKVERVKGSKKKISTIRKKMISAMTKAAHKVLREGILRGGIGGKPFRPLSPMTILLRGGSKNPLFHTGALADGFKTQVFHTRTKSTGAVVAKRKNHKPSGFPMAVIMRIHEFGVKPKKIPVTDGLRKFFIMLSIKSNGAIKPIPADVTSVMHPGIPARPFMEPTARQVELLMGKLRPLILAAMVP